MAVRSVDVILSSRNKHFYIVENYIYECEKSASRTIYARCIEGKPSKCKGRAILEGSGINVNLKKLSGTHNHEPDGNKIKRSKIINSMKAKVRANPNAPIRKAYQATVNEAFQEVEGQSSEEEIAAIMPTFTSTKKSLHHQRHALRPNLPGSRESVNLQGPWTEVGGDTFLLFEDGTEDKIIGFATPEFLGYCARIRTAKFFATGHFVLCLICFFSFIQSTLFTRVKCCHSFTCSCRGGCRRAQRTELRPQNNPNGF